MLQGRGKSHPCPLPDALMRGPGCSAAARGISRAKAGLLLRQLLVEEAVVEVAALLRLLGQVLPDPPLLRNYFVFPDLTSQPNQSCLLKQQL
jgi:hypothetical protein